LLVTARADDDEVGRPARRPQVPQLQRPLARGRAGPVHPLPPREVVQVTAFTGGHETGRERLRWTAALVDTPAPELDGAPLGLHLELAGRCEQPAARAHEPGGEQPRRHTAEVTGTAGRRPVDPLDPQERLESG